MEGSHVINHVDNAGGCFVLVKGYGSSEWHTSASKAILKNTGDYPVYYAWISSRRNWPADACTRMDKLAVLQELLQPEWVADGTVQEALALAVGQIKEEKFTMSQMAARDSEVERQPKRRRRH